jgi:hypothetical protein
VLWQCAGGGVGGQTLILSKKYHHQSKSAGGLDKYREYPLPPKIFPGSGIILPKIRNPGSKKSVGP